MIIKVKLHVMYQEHSCMYIQLSISGAMKNRDALTVNYLMLLISNHQIHINKLAPYLIWYDTVCL